MTIAAGFNFDHGLLLCADTKQSGEMTIYQSKVYWKECLSGAKCVFVFAGNVKYAQMTIRKIEQAIDALKNPSLEAMETAIEKVLLRVHKDHIYKHPDRNTAYGPEVSLLVGLWSPVDYELRAYSTAETAISPFYGYECVGTGNYLGHYIIKPRYHGRVGGLESVIFTALLALERIKRYDRDCGGYSDFVVLSDTGQITVKSTFDIEKGEEFSQFFYGMVNIIYEDIARNAPDPSDENIKQLVDKVMRTITDKRVELESGKTRLEELVKTLSRRST